MMGERNMWLLGLSRILQFGLVVTLDTLTSREAFETFALHNPDRIFYPKQIKELPYSWINLVCPIIEGAYVSAISERKFDLTTVFGLC